MILKKFVSLSKTHSKQSIIYKKYYLNKRGKVGIKYEKKSRGIY